MIYATDLVLPKNTPINNPVYEVLQVTSGLVYKIEVDFPPGPWGLVGVAILDGLYQIYPSTPGMFFRSDNRLIAFDDVYLKQAEPFEFKIIGYNIDDAYNHAIKIRVGMVSKTVFMARFLPHLSYEFYKEMIIELQEAQEEQRAIALNNPFPWL